MRLRPVLLVLAACIAYGYLMKPLGLVLATGALVIVSALGGHEFRCQRSLGDVGSLAADGTAYRVMAWRVAEPHDDLRGAGAEPYAGLCGDLVKREKLPFGRVATRAPECGPGSDRV